MMQAKRTPVENPYCFRQLATQEPIETVSWSDHIGWCPDCDRLVDLRKNGTAKLHRIHGRAAMARRVAEYKRRGTL